MGESLPIAGKYVTDALKAQFKDTIDQLISDMGRVITLYFEPTASGCSNCGIGPNGKSNGIYNSSNPFTLNGRYNRAFPTGGICPICRGTNKIFTASTQQYTALIGRSPKDIDYEAVGGIPENIYSTKMQVVAYEDLKRAKFAMIDGEKCVRIQDPVKTGLSDLRYTKCWWRKED